MDDLEKLRSQLNYLDDKIMALLDERFAISKEVGQLKHRNNLPIHYQNREQYILDKTSKYSASPQIKAIYKTLFIESKNLQK
ncbi:MAG: chorismate mutase [Candidatus Izimaplasma sp.]|nr:chorismate mutase [Candidatus Izimaplasma bacterium]